MLDDYEWYFYWIQQYGFLPTGDASYNLIAFDFDGKIKWERNIISTSAPLINRDSVVFLPSILKTLTAYNHSGDTIWNAHIDKTNNVGLNIDKQGNLYFVDIIENETGVLKVVDKNGKILWTFSDDRILIWHDSMPSFSPDGNTLYIQGESVSLIALDIQTKTIKWTFGNESLVSAPVIDNDGNIFIKPGKFGVSNTMFYSLSSEGEINWEYEVTSGFLFDNTEPTIDWNGNVYFGHDTLYSFTNNGKLRWKMPLEGDIISPIISDINNNIYIGTYISSSASNEKLYSFDDKGNLIWESGSLDFKTLGGCPAITNDNKLLFPSWRNALLSVSIFK